jgi:hypothetical protein
MSELTDTVKEMRAVIDKATATAQGGGYFSRQVADEIVADLRAHRPALLSAWLNEQAAQFIWQMINNRDRSIRAAVRSTARATQFGTDVATGDPAKLLGWLDVPFVVSDGSRKPLASLVADDLRFVAGTYETRSEENLMTAAFFRVLARKVGTRPVGDVYSSEKLDSLWSSLRTNSRQAEPSRD